MKISNLIDKRLKKESEMLLASVLKCDRFWLHLHPEFEVEQNSVSSYLEKLSKLQNNFPLEYLTGEVSFFSQIFFIEEGVLIPRPETEILIEKTEAIINKYEIKKVAEIGSGSGIISIILAQNNPHISIISGDINPIATSLANKNLDKFQIKNVDFVQSNLFENLGDDIELLVSNPPYIQNNFNLPKNVTFEPSNALFGGENGDEILKQIIDGCSRKKIRFLCCEMGYDQKNAIEKYLENFSTIKIEFYKDLAEFDRGFCVEFKID